MQSAKPHHPQSPVPLATPHCDPTSPTICPSHTQATTTTESWAMAAWWAPPPPWLHRAPASSLP